LCIVEGPIKILFHRINPFVTYEFDIKRAIDNISCEILLRKLLYTHLLRLKNTCKLLKCLSAVNCRIMKPAAVNYRGKLWHTTVNYWAKLQQLTAEETSDFFFFDKNHKLSLLIFIDFECFNHYFGTFQKIAVLYLCIYILIRISFKYWPKK